MKLKYIVIFALCALVAFSCKKTETTETKDFLDGRLTISYPKYVAAGYRKDFCLDSLKKVSRPDKGPIGYYVVDVGQSRQDTLIFAGGAVRQNTFYIKAPEKIGNYSFMLGAYCPDKYYGSTVTTSFTVVKVGFNEEGSTLTNFPEYEDDKRFTDIRDDKEYIYTTINGVDWMRQNLSWEGSGYSYANSEVMTDIFGRFYTWDEAQIACPDGWVLPSDEDWINLAKYFKNYSEDGVNFDGLGGKLMADIYFNGKKMWEFWKDVKITDESCLSLMPLGYGMRNGKSLIYQSLGKYAALWTSSTVEDYGIARYIYQDRDIVYRGELPKDDVVCPIRCIRRY